MPEPKPNDRLLTIQVSDREAKMIMALVHYVWSSHGVEESPFFDALEKHEWGALVDDEAFDALSTLNSKASMALDQTAEPAISDSDENGEIEDEFDAGTDVE